jgi:hypothetical protein
MDNTFSANSRITTQEFEGETQEVKKDLYGDLTPPLCTYHEYEKRNNAKRRDDVLDRTVGPQREPNRCQECIWLQILELTIPKLELYLHILFAWRETQSYGRFSVYTNAPSNGNMQ